MGNAAVNIIASSSGKRQQKNGPLVFLRRSIDYEGRRIWIMDIAIGFIVLENTEKNVVAVN